MPTYEYACTACGSEWEAEHSMKDPVLTECPACKQQTARRQISRGTGFILKGSGWYSDLYSSSSNKKPEGDKKSDAGGEKTASTSDGSSSSGTSSDSSSSSGSTTTTPAAATPAKPTPSTSS